MPADASTPGPIEVRRLTPALRAYSAAVWAGSGALFLFLGVRYPTAGHELGFVLAAGLLWLALYWLCVPAVIATADDAGFDYVDARAGAFFVFVPRRAAWSDVVAVDSRRIPSRTGSYLRTRVTVRDGDRTRRFAMTSRARGYDRFLAALRERTATAPPPATGLGADPRAAEAARRGTAGARFAVVAGLGLLLLLVVSVLARR